MGGTRGWGGGEESEGEGGGGREKRKKTLSNFFLVCLYSGLVASKVEIWFRVRGSRFRNISIVVIVVVVVAAVIVAAAVVVVVVVAVVVLLLLLLVVVVVMWWWYCCCCIYIHICFNYLSHMKLLFLTSKPLETSVKRHIY